MQEVWQDIRGYEGLYQVSNWMRVKSLQKDIITAFGVQTLPEKILEIKLRGKNRYLQVNLYKDGISATHLLHRLVADAFVPNPDNLPIVNHKDGIKINCFPSNLEWGTQSYNVEHAFSTGLRKVSDRIIGNVKRDGALNFNARSVVQMDLKGNDLKTWSYIKEAASALNIRAHSISDAANGRQRTAGGFIWRYADAVKQENPIESFENTWYDVPNFEGLYKYNHLRQIKSLPRLTKSVKGYQQYVQGGFVKPKGSTVWLRKDGKTIAININKLPVL